MVLELEDDDNDDDNDDDDDDDVAIPARQMKCVPTAHAHGIHVIATDV